MADTKFLQARTMNLRCSVERPYVKRELSYARARWKKEGERAEEEEDAGCILSVAHFRYIILSPSLGRVLLTAAIASRYISAFYDTLRAAREFVVCHAVKSRAPVPRGLSLLFVLYSSMD